MRPLRYLGSIPLRLARAWKSFRRNPYNLYNPENPDAFPNRELPKRRTCEEAHEGIALPGETVWYAKRTEAGQWKLHGPASILSVWIEKENTPFYYLNDTYWGSKETFPALQVFPSRELAFTWLEKQGLLRLEDVIHRRISSLIMNELRQMSPSSTEEKVEDE
jgi:hypothetical protein